MTITKLNAAQFSEYAWTSGVMLEYVTTPKSGKNAGLNVSTGLHVDGSEYTPNSGAREEVFAVWKRIISLFWTTRYETKTLKEDNSGIASKLRATTPAVIAIRDEKGNLRFRWYASESTYAKVGIMPGVSELKLPYNEYKKRIHKAAVASFNALYGRIDLKFNDPEDEKKAKETQYTEVGKASVESAGA